MKNEIILIGKQYIIRFALNRIEKAPNIMIMVSTHKIMKRKLSIIMKFAHDVQSKPRYIALDTYIFFAEKSKRCLPIVNLC